MIPAERGDASHVRSDGTPKWPFTTKEEATEAARALELQQHAPFTWYVCSLKPEHYHVGRVRPPKSVR